jgi:hypothetical protein
MPYIKIEKRDKYIKVLKELDMIEECVDDVGELNFMITTLCYKYLNREGKSYKAFNDIIGVLECSKLEFYRRQVSDYEEYKRTKNGDVS